MIRSMQIMQDRRHCYIFILAFIHVKLEKEIHFTSFIHVKLEEVRNWRK